MSTAKHKTREKRKKIEDGFRFLQGEQEYVSYPDESSVRIWPSEDPYMYPRHYHSAVEIVLTVRGKVEMEIRGNIYQITQDQILVVPPEIPHSLLMRDGSKRLLFLFEPVMLMSMRDLVRSNDELSKPIFLKEDTSQRREITGLLLMLNEIYQGKRPFWNTRCYSVLLEIYALLSENAIQEHSKGNQVSTIDPEIMNSAIEFIRQNYTQPLTLNQIADFVGFSRFYFSRAFKQYTGIPFSSYLVQTRLDAAERNLLFDKLPIHEIAIKSGFQSMATFNRVFREYKKCSPTQYRKIYGERNLEEEHSKWGTED